jgi:DNA-binding XRE family transcriptional regulator
MDQALTQLRDGMGDRRALPAPPTRRALREAAGATLLDVGRAVGVTPQAISNWELGHRTPRGALLKRYLDALAILRAGP